MVYHYFLRFELRFFMGKKINISWISLNIHTPIPRIDTHPLHPLYSSENLTTQLYIISRTKKTIVLPNYPQNYNIPVLVLIHQKRKQPYKSVICVRTPLATPLI